jgi:CubicO group peptidase (beta-lactamase class C family)
MNRGRAILLSLLCAALLATSLAILAGCSQGKPQVIVFLGKSSRSYDQTKAVIDKMKKQFDDKASGSSTTTIRRRASPRSPSTT